MNSLVISLVILLALRNITSDVNADYYNEEKITLDCNGTLTDVLKGFDTIMITGRSSLNKNWNSNIDDLMHDRNDIRTLIVENCTVAHYDTLADNLIDYNRLRSLHLVNLDLKSFDFGSIANIVRLRALHLDNNPNLKEVKGTCGVNLEFISLQNCGFTKIPSELDQFKTSLRVLIMNGNNVKKHLDSDLVCESFPKLSLFNDDHCNKTSQTKKNGINNYESKELHEVANQSPEGSSINSTDKTNTNGSLQVKSQNFIINFLLLAAFQLTFPKRYGIFMFMITMVMTTCEGQTTDNQLIIRNKNINILNEGYFQNVQNDLSVYTEIHMESSNILYIDINAFSAFNNLTHLYLRDNRLRTFGISASKLEVLDLSFNEIEELNQSFFEDYASLETIKLSGNQLKHIEWNLGFHQNIKRIDLSANSDLELVKIASERLKVLLLNNNTNFELNLETPNLKNLDMRFAKPRRNIKEYCYLNKMVTIYYINGGTPEIYNCRDERESGSAEVNKMLTTSTNVGALLPAMITQRSDEEAAKVEKRVGCEFSTLKATYGDVILSREEYTTFLLCFMTLILTTSILILSHTYLMYEYLRSKQNCEYQTLPVNQ